ncbi:MAG: YbjN domain-containing protein [Variibacter sp.]|nr:YbjN domain-containing protein [Variibacter sp.]
MMVGCALSLTVASLAVTQPRLGGGGGGGGGQPAQPAPAAGMIAAITPDQTAKLMTEAGYKDVRFVEHQGQRHVGGKIDQTEVFAMHLACESGACPVVSFTVFLGQQPNLQLDYLNAWNSEQRFAKLYRNKDNSWTFDMDIHLFGGVSPEYVKRSSIIFGSLLKKLYQFKPQ